MKVKTKHADGETTWHPALEAQIEVGGNKYLITELETDIENGNMLKVTKVGKNEKQDVIALVPTGAVNSIFIK